MLDLDDWRRFREWALLQQQQPAGLQDAGDSFIVVFKQHRFYKQLCIELYRAQTTQSGKLKNPLQFVNPLDIIWRKNNPGEIKFLAAVARFQNNATTNRSPQDMEALQAILQNPMQWQFYLHNAQATDNVVASALQAVSVGEEVRNICIYVQKKNNLYEIRPELQVAGKAYPLAELNIKHDYFVLLENKLHLLNDFTAMQALQLFSGKKQSLVLHESRFGEFKTTVLEKLEDKIPVYYQNVSATTEDFVATTNAGLSERKFIYLSELGDFVIIDPVMRYGDIDIPVRTKRQVHASDEKGKLFTIQRNDAEEIRFTGLLLQQHPFFEEQLDSDLPYFYLHRKRFLEASWFLNAFGTWQDNGITVLGFNKLKNNKLNGNKVRVNIRITSGTNWFNANMDVKFGHQQASLKQLQQAVKNKHKYVQLDDGTLGILPDEWLQKFEAYFAAAETTEDGLQIPKARFSELEQWFEEAEMDKEVKQELTALHLAFSDFENISDVRVPETLQTELRHYQQEGLNWLAFLHKNNFGGCLADDMGLGKTIQVLAFVLWLQQTNNKQTHLLAVPTSLVFNWQNEIQKFAPSLRVFIIKESKKMKYPQLLNEYDIIIISYGMLITAVSWLRHHTFNYVFADESQQIKNIDSQRYRSLRLLQAKNKIAITGTPIENNVFDLYAQMSFANPGLLGNRQYFRDTYAIPIDKFKIDKRAKELQQKVVPFILRRTKQQVATELPDKTEMILYCPMEEGQRKLYDAYEKEFRDYIEAETEDELKKSPMHVLRGITRLRQICDSPVLLEDEKLYTEGAAKIEMLLEQIESKAPQHKILVFSQFVSMLQLIKQELLDRQIGFEWLSGSTKDRETVVKNFQENNDVRVFLISLKAGGTGLNLTQADYVYLVDPWWNPAVENQAIDRVYRIGQEKPVVAVRLICPDTVEEKIMKLQELKKSLSENIISSDENFFQSLSKNDLLHLLS